MLYVPSAVAPDLASDLVTGWTADVAGAATIVPDGCVDVLWISTGVIRVCGPETSAWSFALPPGTEAVGVRFRAGRAGSVLDFDTAELRNRRASLDDVLGSRPQRLLGDQIGAAEDQRSRLRVLQDHAREWLGAAAPEDSAAETVRRMLVHDSRTTVAEMAEATGLCARQLNRRCVRAFGYGPSMLRRILRLQRFLRMARHPGAPIDLATLAVAAGYTDQPHLSRDCREIARSSPGALVGR
ncbi:helix-turn-helix domain-containing protein [Saccharopolyspora spinosa]|uniref:AraC family transcriptional regulator n=1 Tax=Saccharopolyspora spinosa TaxID=60894 RepID=A0A2N3XXC3_SACSN|nr:helix-turn-helix domain-containing protein [Saccharopolyspora spinosa]PKW15281.1 AraC family transcriptional regulator [Saccharopolyspora spinosa]